MAMVAAMLLPWGAGAGEATTQGVKAADGVLAAGVALCGCLLAGWRKREGISVRITGIDCVVAGMAALQAFWVCRAWGTVDREVVWRLAAGGMAYAAARACGWRGERWGWWTLLAVWTAQALFGLEEATDGFRRWRDWRETTGSFGNSGIWSGFTACAGVAAWACLRGSREWRGKALACAGVAVTLAGLVAGDSRAAWLGYAVGSVAGWRGTLPGRWRSAAVVAGGAVAIAAVAAIGARPERAASAEGRVLVWKVAGRIFAEHPWGTGADGFRRMYGTAQGEYLRTEGTERECLLADETVCAFNEGVRTAVETGIPGLVGLALLAWRALRRGRRTGNGTDSLAEDVRSVLAAWMAFALFSYPAAVFQCWAVFVVALAARASGEEAVAVFRIRGRMAAMAAVATLAVVAAHFPYRRALAAWEDCLRAERVEPRAFEAALRPLRNSFYVLTNSAILLNQEGRHEEAETAARRAAELYASYAAFVEWGIAAEGLGAHARADFAWQRAEELLPMRLKPPYYRMEARVKLGDTTGARELARRILALPTKAKTAETLYIRKRAAAVAATEERAWPEKESHKKTEEKSEK